MLLFLPLFKSIVCAKHCEFISVSALNVLYPECSFACEGQSYKESCMMFFAKSNKTRTLSQQKMEDLHLKCTLSNKNKSRHYAEESHLKCYIIYIVGLREMHVSILM